MHLACRESVPKICSQIHWTPITPLTTVNTFQSFAGISLSWFELLIRDLASFKSINLNKIISIDLIFLLLSRHRFEASSYILEIIWIDSSYIHYYK